MKVILSVNKKKKSLSIVNTPHSMFNWIIFWVFVSYLMDISAGSAVGTDPHFTPARILLWWQNMSELFENSSVVFFKAKWTFVSYYLVRYAGKFDLACHSTQTIHGNCKIYDRNFPHVVFFQMKKSRGCGNSEIRAHLSFKKVLNIQTLDREFISQLGTDIYSRLGAYSRSGAEHSIGRVCLTG